MYNLVTNHLMIQSAVLTDTMRDTIRFLLDVNSPTMLLGSPVVFLDPEIERYPARRAKCCGAMHQAVRALVIVADNCEAL